MLRVREKTASSLGHRRNPPVSYSHIGQTTEEGVTSSVVLRSVPITFRKYSTSEKSNRPSSTASLWALKTFKA
jgi:hypothetical protein